MRESCRRGEDKGEDIIRMAIQDMHQRTFCPVPELNHATGIVLEMPEFMLTVGTCQQLAVGRKSHRQTLVGGMRQCAAPPDRCEPPRS